MNFSLTPQLEVFVRERVVSGCGASKNEVEKMLERSSEKHLSPKIGDLQFYDKLLIYINFVCTFRL